MIIEKECVPPCSAFEERIIDKYYPGVDREAARTQVNIAYKSLLTDIHFYFLLVESGIFDSVEMSFSHDLFVKSDILLTSGDISVGLQLFAGDDTYEKTKRLSLERIKQFVSYPIHPYRLKPRGNWVDANGRKLSLYDEQDVIEVFGIMQGHEAGEEMDLTPEEGVDRYALHDLHEAGKTADRQNQGTGPRHSVVYGGSFDDVVIDSAIRRGIKVYHIPVDIEGVTPFFIQDGQGHHVYADYLKKYGHNASRFNYAQYAVEHADIGENITINAGAGSGKTTTLIARIMFLLNTGAVHSLSEVAMITFTNEAVNNMEAALAKELVRLTKETGNTVYLRHLNELRRMDILTIPSFAKSILNQFGQHIGLGSNISVSQMTMERRAIIDEVLDEKLREAGQQNFFSGIWYYKVREFVENLWEKFEQKGFIHEDLAVLPDSKEAIVNVIMESIIESDRRLDVLKNESDALGVSDLTRYLKRIVSSAAPLSDLSSRYKYLMVDEFQDTDISQISFIADLIISTGIRLIVVGDVKQGIYRFRGADSSAFSVLQSALESRGGQRQVSYHLDENFRSTKRLVEMMEHHFSTWRNSGYLPDDEDGMYSRKIDSDSRDSFFVFEGGSIEIEDIKGRFNELPDKSVLAILVRDNADAEKIGSMLRDDGVIKNYEVRMDGTLFRSRAAKDLLILIKSWIFPEDRNMQFSLGGTAYTRPTEPMKLRRFTGPSGESLVEVENNEIVLDKIWSEAQTLIKNHPLLRVLDHFIEGSKHLEYLKEAGVPGSDIKKYELNLQKILLMVHETFLDGPLDILALYNWLEIQVSTNHETDEADIEDWSFNGNIVRVLTVHRSKGLQFDTVMIPFTSKSMVRHVEFIKDDIIVLAEESSDIEYGWRFVEGKDFDFTTANYLSLKQEEDAEQIKEECRLLYVAMTRAISRIFIYETDKAKKWGSPRTWGELLQMGR
ncbi:MULTISPECIES: exodeoxyribonuclease V subunit beta [unclassified Exiguobacterium]|uniref:UvrD-helicase domain-containing protein n=1 Tax=unclassified Exiguobacterium TaxID=2644629 RepID=UPI001376438B|nr:MULTISPECIES: ATP-dependent helicase [unclassified Exiguobacterium]